MSQHQSRRNKDEAIKYGEVFNVSGELARQPITPRDAATLQSVEGQILGETRKGGPAAMMESAAAKNQRASVVDRKDVTNIARNEGVTISKQKNERGNSSVVTETLGGQVVGQYEEADEAKDELDVNYGGGSGDSSLIQAPHVKPTKDDEYDFISNQDDATSLNPRLSAADHLQQNILSTILTGQENPNVTLSSVPGGMGASMATADQRLTKNK
ncbi:late embryogenesis abundant protein D-34-like [Arachis stenosperma]|uniref:late embryogenesis abundant protein D-34-like n=1 Tax=Arachis stenosperma TaxID=217475 RepID=UPI0025AC9E78|nr:late embryogenesis abundant protein D-34-like [Arachis stenosperma]